MDASTVIKCICALAVSIIFVTNFYFPNVYGKANVSVSPSCGPKSGFNFSVRASGLPGDTIASWELQDSDDKSRLNGYFKTDSYGNINDQTSIEDVERGEYVIYFGYDTNNDGKIDSEVKHFNIGIPCR